MSAPLDDIASYSAYVYTLQERRPFVTGSTLTVAPMGATLAKVEGRVECEGGVCLEVWELVDFVAHRIRSYSYEVYRAGEKVGWYDAWPHPETPGLAATFPHHKHVTPDLRHHRVAAPGIRFDAPNLDVVLEDIRAAFLPPAA
jgi:hypothetical protein